MKTDENQMKDFLKAVSLVGIKSGGNEAACHHSAVEVNEWGTIQKALLEATSKEAHSQLGGNANEQ
jgi:hypothetical protein